MEIERRRGEVKKLEMRISNCKLKVKLYELSNFTN